MAAAIERELIARTTAQFAEEARPSARVYHSDFDRFRDLRERRSEGERLAEVDLAFLARFEADFLSATGT